ncbi:hypothetical protein MPH_09224 [Macrophomina phaseolina MS6]|uniref:Uncharacterized protein n=1 Tax=Macrophomina phaseolina (strain MS6) TaxID=1126212 RepID=K2S9P0_MACPH|nr:hypothetical protein MPH_09224 [Macrophomina phaseolina MS6]
MNPITAYGEHEVAERPRPWDSSDELLTLEDGTPLEEETLLRKGSLSETRRPSSSVFTPLKRSAAIWVAILVFLAFSIAVLFAVSATASAKLSTSQNHAVESFDGFPIKTDEVGDYIECPADSPESARMAGCSFDVLLYGWLPNACFDEEMYRDITSGADYGFYLDRQGQLPIAMAELMKGDYMRYPEAYVSVEEHWQHCTYMLNSSLRFRAKMPPTSLNLHLDQHHIGHCLKFLLDPATKRSRDVTQTRALFTAKRRCYLRQHSQFR